MFSTTAGEHLNRCLKVYEAEHTSRGTKWFKKILQMFRVSMFHFSKTLMETAKAIKAKKSHDDRSTGY